MSGEQEAVTTESIMEAAKAGIAEDMAALAGEETGDTEGTEEQEADESSESDETVEDEEQEADEADDEPEPVKGMVPISRLKAKNDKIAALEKRSAAVEDRYNQLLEYVQNLAAKPQEQAQDDGVSAWLAEKGIDIENSLDPEAIIAMAKSQMALEAKLTDGEKKADHKGFEQALRAEQSAGESKYPDFGDAYVHYVKAIASVIAEEAEESGVEVDSIAAAKQQLALHLKQRHESGKNLAEWIYKQAQRAGYTQKAKKGLNPEAIERNRAKTEKKQTPKARPEQGVGKDDMKKYFKNGSFDVKLFQEDTQKIISAVS